MGLTKAGGIRALATANTQFAVDIYKQLKSQDGNLILSPYSISSALAMMSAGAKNETLNQTLGVFHFEPLGADLHTAFNGAQGILNTPSQVREWADINYTKEIQKPAYELHVANRIWGQKEYAFEKSFLDICGSQYGAGLAEADFVKAPDAARLDINQWVEQKTQNRINDILQPGIVQSDWRLVLVNAIYFKSNWANEFDTEATRSDEFYLSKEKTIYVPMMSLIDSFSYYENKTLQTINMPYKAGDLSMIVLLPKARDGLAALENALSSGLLKEVIDGLSAENSWNETDVTFPKFKIESSFSLKNHLTAMGMKDAFQYGPADFSGISGNRDLFIGDVIHKGFVEVDEKGTEAAAATAVIWADGDSKRQKEPIVFRADHPFIYLIRDNRTGSILFIGRLVNPPAASDLNNGAKKYND